MTIRMTQPRASGPGKFAQQHGTSPGSATGASVPHIQTASPGSRIVARHGLRKRDNCVGIRVRGVEIVAGHLAHRPGGRTGPSRPRTDHLDLHRLTLQQRRGLTRSWIHEAQGAQRRAQRFERLARDLLRLEAPRELIRAAQRAAASTRVHARLYVELASAYEGRPLDADALAGDDTGGPTRDAELAMVLVQDGCVAGSVKAVAARSAASTCTHRAVRRVMRRVAVDETRIAALGWRYLEWALGGQGPLAAGSTFLAHAVRAAFDELSATLTIPSPPRHPSHERWLAEHGVLSARAKAEIGLTAMREVVVPCARALLEAQAVRGARVA